LFQYGERTIDKDDFLASKSTLASGHSTKPFSANAEAIFSRGFQSDLKQVQRMHEKPTKMQLQNR